MKSEKSLLAVSVFVLGVSAPLVAHAKDAKDGTTQAKDGTTIRGKATQTPSKREITVQVEHRRGNYSAEATATAGSSGSSQSASASYNKDERTKFNVGVSHKEGERGPTLTVSGEHHFD